MHSRNRFRTRSRIFWETKAATDGQAAKPVDLADVSEEEVAKALDHLEKQLGFTLTGPVRELVNTRIVNVLSKSLGVIARNEQSQDVVYYLLPRNSEVPLERMTDFGTDADNQAAVDIRVMAGERDTPTRSIARKLAWPRSTCPSACRPAARSASSSPSTRMAGSASRLPI